MSKNKQQKRETLNLSTINPTIQESWIYESDRLSWIGSDKRYGVDLSRSDRHWFSFLMLTSRFRKYKGEKLAVFFFLVLISGVLFSTIF